MKTILAPIDFSSATNGVVETARNLAQALKARIILLHILQPPIITTEPGMPLDNFREIVAASEKHATARLAEISNQLRPHALDVEVELVSGAPVSEILACAHRVEANYIIVGSHGHTALYDLIVGTTTHGILKKSPCPVVIVPAEKT